MLQYHSGDEYANTKTEARVEEYEVEGFPSMFFNGGNVVMGGWDGCYDAYSAVINEELIKPVSAAIAGTMTTGSNTLSFNVVVTNISDNNITDVKVMAVVYEDLGTDEHHYVVRDMQTLSTIANLTPGSTQQFTLSSNYSGNLSNLKAVFFLQLPSGEILQSVPGSS